MYRKLITSICFFTLLTCYADALGGSRRLLLLSKTSSSSPQFPLPGALIDENFVTGQYFPGPITGDLVDTRSTTKTVTDASGILSTVAINTLPITNAGLLVEPAATNPVLQSKNFSTSWTNARLTVGATTTAPDNTNTAQLISQTAATGIISFVQQGSAITQGNYTLSVYFKNSGSNFAIMLNDLNNGSAVVFNAATASVIGISIHGTPITVLASGVIPVGNGFFRAYATFNKSGSTANSQVGGWLQNGTATDWIPSTVGNASNGVYLWGFQQEAAQPNFLPTSYIPTTTVPVTRAADSIVVQETGIGQIVFTFDDGSTQALPTNPATQTTIPVNFTRFLITRMTGYAVLLPFRQAAAISATPDLAITVAQAASIQPFFARVRMDAIQIVIPNFYTPNTGVETSTGGTLTAQASIEYPTGTFTPFTFGGSATGTATSSQKLLTSDELDLFIPKGAQAKLRLFGTTTTAFGMADNVDSSIQFVTQSGVTAPNITTGGTLTATNPTNMWMASVIAARHNQRAVGGFGDSICWGTVNNAPTKGVFAPSISPTLPFINMGVPGDASYAQVAPGNATVRIFLGNTYLTSGVNNIGYNDLQQGFSGASVIANRATFASLFSIPILQSTVTPSGTSTDNFATPGNQTPTFNAQRVVINNSVRGMPKFIEITIPLEFGLNSGIWRSIGDGTVLAPTTSSTVPWSGIHPLSQGYDILSASGSVNVALFP